MLILIAESKTMLDAGQPIAPEVLAGHTPAGEAGATLIMNHLAGMSQPELIAATGLSATLVARLRQMIYEFPNKLLGMRAIEAYTGVVFKALQVNTLDDGARSALNRDVRIISSLYGLLRPDDIIKSYRLDFTTKAAPGDSSLCAFGKKDVTINLVKTLKESGQTEILNLLPADAAKCVDWKLVKRFCKVWKVDFVEMSDGGTTKTPTATRLKTARGRLLRAILSHDIRDVDTLRTFTDDNFLYQGTPVYPDHLQFLCHVV